MDNQQKLQVIWQRHRLYIIGIGFFVCSALLIVFFSNIKPKPSKVASESLIIEEESKEKIKTNIKVDLKGEVKNPGVYELVDQSVVSDLLEKAGGLTEKADTTYINLSKKLKDEMVIIVYSKEEIEKMKNGESSIVVVEGECKCPNLTNDGCLKEENVITNQKPNTNSSTGKININTASIEELMTLNGIGKAKANDIINYRKEHGLFQSVEEIKNVKGIGDTTYEKLQDKIVVS